MAQFETLASGFGLLEGPRCDERNRLYFSDVPNGGVYRRSPDGSIETLIPKRRGVGGIALNEAGGIVCTGRGLIYWNEATRTSRDLFVEWEGRKLNGLNDLQPDDHGSIFVGSLEHNALEPGAKRIPGSLYRVDPDGKVTKLYEGIETTNGMGFSPDRKHLYHADSTTKAVWVYDVQPDRTVKDRRVFAKMPAGWPDGLAIDAEGGVVVAIVNYGEVVRFKPDATLDWRMKVPAEMVTSVTFGGADLRDLYIVTADNAEDASRKGTIFRTRVEIPGLPVPKARFN
ncbi:MAG TPA: SMP-30/gluconolactonase/LRE family protein [Candidatus Binataceae bacterium]|nr:SMP-30/gluconolactonase/LRE family protein [Candidatus Binataceae bacterium]